MGMNCIGKNCIGKGWIGRNMIRKDSGGKLDDKNHRKDR